MLNQRLADGGKVISEDLKRAQEPEHLLLLLKQFGFTNEDISKATGTDIRTVRRWKETSPGASAAEKLASLRNLVLCIRATEGLTDRGALYWLRHPNRLLDDYAPLDVLAVDGFRCVREAALCFVDPERSFNQPLSAEMLRKLGDGNGTNTAAPVPPHRRLASA